MADEITDPKMIDHHSGDTGAAGLKQIVTSMHKAFPDLKVTVNNLIAEGDLVVADVTFDEGIYKGGRQRHLVYQTVLSGRASKFRR